MKSENVIYLHVGLGKTGTTTIQYGLRDNYDELIKLGYLYPKSGRHAGIEKNSCHHNLAFEIDQDPRYISTHSGFKDLVEEIKTSSLSNIVISSECFLPRHAPTVHNLLSPLGRVNIIYYVRRQDQWFTSIWAQRMKETGFVLTFPEAMAEIFYKTGYFSNGVKAWAKIFGKENMKVRVLEHEQLFRGDLFLDFIYTCDIRNFDELKRPSRENPSPSIKVLEMTRIIRKTLKEKNLSIEKELGTSIFFLVSEIADENNWERERPVHVNRELYEEIESRYAKTNKQLALDYFNRDKLFYEEYREEPQTRFMLSDVSSEEILEVMSEMIARLQKH